MLNGLLGRKLGMTGIYDEKGNRIPVTAVEVGPVYVVQKKSIDNDGYQAVQVGFDKVTSKGKTKNFSKPLAGHFGDVPFCKTLKEFQADNPDDIAVGQEISAAIFEKNQFVDVIGTSKGRGFSGVIKRHGFGGGPASHGHRFHRTTGSIGNRSTPGRVFKNKRMPGQYGNEQVTVRALQIIDVLTEKNILLIKGALPGPTGGILQVMRTKKNL